jgi:GTP-binding protein Era
MILSDTQELLSLHEMQASMMNFVKSAFEDADILIYMVEIGARFKDKRSSIKSFIQKYLFCYC